MCWCTASIAPEPIVQNRYDLLGAGCRSRWHLMTNIMCGAALLLTICTANVLAGWPLLQNDASTDLRRTLVALPVTAWPYGRVVALQDIGIRVSDRSDEQPIADIRNATLAILKTLQVTVERWLSQAAERINALKQNLEPRTSTQHLRTENQEPL